MTDSAGEIKEIDDALEAIRKALYALNQAEERLRDARTWSTYDSWFGGFAASVLKRQKVDRADQSVRSVDYALAEVRRELADVDIHDVGGLGVGSTARTLDVWFDNLFTDLWIGRRLKKAQERSSRISRALVTMQSQLQGRRAELLTKP
ncbi:hypothetical protein [Nocardioides sp. SR21]|uniref:hypothetical protein n=1 Tax=Nocardioides sp. SR21 TaxID=2919501 RepID=UPI001FA9CAFE|nr:hypothetical protein [Nocardioides sp. SR21]